MRDRHYRSPVVAPARSTSSIYRPPPAPLPSPLSTTTTSTSPNTSALRHSTIGDGEDYLTFGSRKRLRQDSQAHRRNPLSPQPPTSSWDLATGTLSDSNAFDSDVLTPRINEKYKLAGGFDTPGLTDMMLESDRGFGRWDDGMNCARHARDDYGIHTVHDAFVPLSGPLARERNGAPRWPAQEPLPSTSSWTSCAFNLVGKVFSVGSSVIKGFYAGGGKGYNLTSNDARSSMISPPVWPSASFSTPIPGSWQDSDDDDDNDNDYPTNRPDPFTEPSSPPCKRPQKKRRQSSRESWIMIDNQPQTPDACNTNDEFPTRRHRSSISSNTGLPRAAPIGRPSASRAGSRRSLVSQPRRSNSYYAQSPHSHHPSYNHRASHSYSGNTSPTHAPRNNPLSRNTSFAQMRSPNRPQSASAIDFRGSTTSLSSLSNNHQYHDHPYEQQQQHQSSSSHQYHDMSSNPTRSRRTSSAAGAKDFGERGMASPISPEADRFLRRQARADRVADRTMSSMSRRLEEMIKQGQAALGTKFSVDDGGYHGDNSNSNNNNNNHNYFDYDAAYNDEGFVDDDDDDVDNGTGNDNDNDNYDDACPGAW